MVLANDRERAVARAAAQLLGNLTYTYPGISKNRLEGLARSCARQQQKSNDLGNHDVALILGAFAGTLTD